MATLKQRMWRKNNAGTYDTIHLETESSLVLRPSGRTVEQDLTDFLPEVQATDDVPETLKRRKLVIGNSKAFLLDKALAFEGATTQVSWDNVTGKPDSYPPETHTHDMVQVTGLEDELSSMQSAIANKANSNHTHSISNITNLQNTLNGKANTEHTHEIADVTNLQTQLNGKAASSHNHSASNITSGTLPVTRGGTGVTANPSMLINLGSTSAASVFQSSPRPGVTGTLPVARGGTGVTSISALKSALGISSSSNTEVLQINLTESRQVVSPPFSVPREALLLDSVTFSKTINTSNIKCTIITAKDIEWYNRSDRSEPSGVCKYSTGYSFTLPSNRNFILYENDSDDYEWYCNVYLRLFSNTVGLYIINTVNYSATVDKPIEITIEISATYA